MVAKKLRPALAISLFQLGKKIGERLRIVTGIPGDDRAHGIGLGFVLTRILHQQRTRAKLDTHPGETSRRALPQNRTGQPRDDSGPGGFGGLFRRVLHINVRHLMGHHPCQFRFIVGRLNRANVHKNGATRKRKSIDVRGLDHMKLIGPGAVRRDHPCQFVSQLLNIARYGA